MYPGVSDTPGAPWWYQTSQAESNAQDAEDMDDDITAKYFLERLQFLEEVYSKRRIWQWLISDNDPSDEIQTSSGYSDMLPVHGQGSRQIEKRP